MLSRHRSVDCAWKSDSSGLKPLGSALELPDRKPSTAQGQIPDVRPGVRPPHNQVSPFAMATWIHGKSVKRDAVEGQWTNRAFRAVDAAMILLFIQDLLSLLSSQLSMPTDP